MNEIFSSGEDFNPKSGGSENDSTIFKNLISEILDVKEMDLFSKKELRISMFIEECKSTKDFESFLTDQEITDEEFIQYYDKMLLAINGLGIQESDENSGGDICRNTTQIPSTISFDSIAAKACKIHARHSDVSFM